MAIDKANGKSAEILVVGHDNLVKGKLPVGIHALEAPGCAEFGDQVQAVHNGLHSADLRREREGWIWKNVKGASCQESRRLVLVARAGDLNGATKLAENHGI